MLGTDRRIAGSPVPRPASSCRSWSRAPSVTGFPGQPGRTQQNGSCHRHRVPLTACCPLVGSRGVSQPEPETGGIERCRGGDCRSDGSRGAAGVRIPPAPATGPGGDGSAGGLADRSGRRRLGQVPELAMLTGRPSRQVRVPLTTPDRSRERSTKIPGRRAPGHTTGGVAGPGPGVRRSVGMICLGNDGLDHSSCTSALPAFS